MTEQLGRLTAVDPRAVWANETHDFTPWLLAHADVLSEAVGMELELDAAEHSVGEFSLDLIGTDRGTGERVIVENQLDTSNHTHLGQILTYAGGTDPTNVVWIATEFREEHRAALEWLNERTDEHTRFFAVKLELVKIGDSSPAPLLTLMVRPNDWGKQVRSTTSSGRSWTEEECYKALADVASDNVVRAARELQRHTREAGPDTYFYWGEGKAPSMTAQVPMNTMRLQPWTLYLDGAPGGGSVLAINFAWIHKAGRGASADQVEEFADRLRQIPILEPYVESARTSEWRKRPSVPAERLFEDLSVLQTITAAFDKLYNDVRENESQGPWRSGAA